MGAVGLAETGPGAEVHPVEMTRVKPRAADTTPRRRNAAEYRGPRRQDLEPALKQDLRPQLSAQPFPVRASYEAESVTRNRHAEDTARALNPCQA